MGGEPPLRITLDLDAWDDETHGQQQFAETAQPQREFVCWQYQARRWSAPRCTIVKVEVNPEGTNRRAILTNRPGGAILPGATYDEYADRGESENRHKELKREMHGDRLSDHRHRVGRT